MLAENFTQSKVIDNVERFSPVIKSESVKNLFAVAASKYFMVHEMVVTTPLVHSDINRELYQKQPFCFVDGKQPLMAWKYHKFL